MKEAFWGVLIIMLGLFGIVIINVFQKATTTNDEVYYVIKEATEAAMYDSIDLTYYRLNGEIRTVEDKFVENLARRFASSITNKGKYLIVVEDINETPPKVSLRVKTGVTSLQGEYFGITNRVDGIIETKYKLDEILDFLEITKEEWETITRIGQEETESQSNYCELKTFNDDVECIENDIRFDGWKDLTIPDRVCSKEDIKEDIKKREAKYSVCECGKWVEKSENVEGVITEGTNQIKLTWSINLKTELRDYTETINADITKDICTTGIEIWTPKDLTKTEPSTDNSQYIKCGVDGIRIPIGKEIVLHPEYIPSNATNRNLTWSIDNNNITMITSTVNTEKGYSKARITGQKVGTTLVSTKTSLGQTATCKVEVWDGSVDSVGCEGRTVTVGQTTTIKSNYTPYNATKTDFTWSISDTSIATINNNTGAISSKKAGTATITVTASNGKTGTCTLNVNENPPSNSSSSSKSSSKTSYYFLEYTDHNGKTINRRYSSYDDAIEAAGQIPLSSDIEVSHIDENKKTIRATGSADRNGTVIKEKNGNTTIVERLYDGVQTTKTDSNGKFISQTMNNTYKSNSSDVNKSNKGTDGSNSQNKGSSSKNNSTTTGGAVNKPKGGCFLKGTKVLTINGYKNIEDISINDKVLSYNETTGKNEYKRVLKIFVHKNSNEKLYSLTINNKIVTSTGAHRFYIKTNNGYDWIAAEDLKVGDIVMDSKGKYYSITKITSKDIIETVYNLEVNDNHNYYVTESKILVHNKKAIK